MPFHRHFFIKTSLASSTYSFNAFNDIVPKGIVLCLFPVLQVTYPSSKLTSSIFKDM